ncbi:hypothetical protein EV361DRAFT_957088 [Lentinula raphanica]|nr:hypothetical protein EV361DRAFT_957088 [Lentinula raphanica]
MEYQLNPDLDFGHHRLNLSDLIDFAQTFSTPDHDFLRPLGGKYVGTLFDDDEVLRLDQSVEDEECTEPDDNMIVDHELDFFSLDEHLDLHQSMHDEDQRSFDHRFLEVVNQADSSKTQKFLKSLLVHILCGGENVRHKVAMHTLRAQGVTINDLQKKPKTDWDSLGNNDNMKVGDPAVVLTRIGKGKDTQKRHSTNWKPRAASVLL